MVTANVMPMFTQTNNFFNWTMTYRRDSDIYDVRTYGALQRRTNALPPPNSMPVRLGSEVLPPDPASMMMTNNNKSISSRHHFLLAEKTKMVAWFVSHCRTDSLREKYFELVGQHVPIDTYGSCGSLTCVPLRSEKCDKLLDS
jgi:alpha-1,3-fucosyltransferase